MPAGTWTTVGEKEHGPIRTTVASPSEWTEPSSPWQPPPADTGATPTRGEEQGGGGDQPQDELEHGTRLRSGIWCSRYTAPGRFVPVGGRQRSRDHAPAHVAPAETSAQVAICPTSDAIGLWPAASSPASAATSAAIAFRSPSVNSTSSPNPTNAPVAIPPKTSGEHPRPVLEAGHTDDRLGDEAAGEEADDDREEPDPRRDERGNGAADDRHAEAEDELARGERGERVVGRLAARLAAHADRPEHRAAGADRPVTPTAADEHLAIGVAVAIEGVAFAGDRVRAHGWLTLVARGGDGPAHVRRAG